jgi:EAL domain-containing protein (putative c-di-GMP-specific phosphodiesterase class I)
MPLAEGVESAYQREVLARQGFTCMQGYLFGKPAPVEEFTAPAWGDDAPPASGPSPSSTASTR